MNWLTSARRWDWFFDRTQERRPARSLAARLFRPQLELLEERITPSHAPVLEAIDDLAKIEGDAVQISPMASDEDNDELAWSATGLPAGLTINESTGVISGSLAFTAGETNDGIYEVSVTVTDPTLLTDTKSFEIAVTPFLAPIADQTWEIDEEIYRPGEYGNVEWNTHLGDLVGLYEFSATGLPSGVSIDSETGLLSGTPDTYGTGTATITVDTGNGEDSITFDWAVVSTPIVATPGEQWTNLDTALELSTTNENAISVATDYGTSSVLTIELEVVDDHGTLTLAQTTGLTFTTGDGTNDTAMTFSGTVADINAALAGLTFTPATSYRGEAIVAVTAIDENHEDGSGDPLTAYGEVGIATGGPVILVPETQATNSAQPLVFSWSYGNGVYIIDPPAGEDGLEITLAIDDGTLTLGATDGLTFTIGDGLNDATMTFSGLLDDINQALQGVVYSPAEEFAGDTTLDISVTDLGTLWASSSQSSSASVAIHVGGPTVSAPDQQWMPGSSSLILSSANGNSITISDPDAGNDGIVKVELSVAFGTLTLAQTDGLVLLTGSGANDASVSFTGIISDINSALDGLVYTQGEDYVDGDSIFVEADDQGAYWSGGNLTASAWIDVASRSVGIFATPVQSGGSALGQFMVYRIADLSTSLTVAYTVGGTAVADDGSGTGDYLPLGGTVTFAAGEDTAPIAINPVASGLFTADATVTIILLAPSDDSFILDSNYTSDEVILTQPPAAVAPTISIFATASTVDVSATDPATFVLYREGDTSASLTIAYEVSGTAIPESSGSGDYVALSGTVTFAAGQISAEIAVTPTGNPVDGAQSIIITLQAPTDNSYELDDSNGIAAIDVVGAVPVIGISATQTNATRGSNDSPSFVVSREEASAHDVTVNLFVGGTAVAGVQYDALPQTVTILAGETSALVPVVLLDDGVVYGDKTLTLGIGNGDTSYDIGPAGYATLTIHDGAAYTTPLVSIEATDWYATEPDPESSDPLDTATFTITRTGDTTSALTVNYTVSGAATPDLQYSALSGSVTIQSGQSSATVTITPLAHDNEEVHEKDVVLTLEAQQGNSAAYAIDSTGLGSAAAWVVDTVAATIAGQASLSGMYFADSIVIYRDPTYNTTTKQVVYNGTYARNPLALQGKTVNGLVLNLAGENPDTSAPFAYAMNTPVHVYATFATANLAAFNAANAAGDLWVRARYVDGAGKTLATYFTTKATLGQKGFYIDAFDQFNQVAYYQNFRLIWEYTTKGKNAIDADWIKAGETTCRMFVTFKQPKGADYITALWQGCKFGAGAKDESELIGKIWQNFAGRKVTDIGGTPMTYYKDWGLEAWNYARLIAQKDGICDGWADYFAHVLQVQGLTSSKTMKIQADYGQGRPAPRPNLLVNNWQVQANVNANQNTFTNILDPNGKSGPQGMRAQKVNGIWEYAFRKTEVDYKESEAQNNDKPLATFGAHVVVQVTMKGADGKTRVVIYDPSYGKKYDDHVKLNDNLLDFQKKALFGFFVVNGNRMTIDKVGDSLQLKIVPYTPKG